MERLSVAIASEALICAAGVVDYAYVKKLTWLMKHKSAQTLGLSERGTRPNYCKSCNKILGRFTLLGKGCACQSCRRVICTRCSVVKKMTVDVSDTGTVKQCALRFCLACLLEAKEKSAWEIAQTGLETTPESSSSSSPYQRYHRRDSRSYSEHRRFGTPVYRKENTTTEVRVNPERVGSSNSRLRGRVQGFHGVRPKHAQSGEGDRHMYRTPSPSNGHEPLRARYSAKPKRNEI